MSFLDFAIILLLIWAVYKGWQQGLLRELISMGGFIIGLFIAATLYSSFSDVLTPRLGTSPGVGDIIAFLLLWIVTPIVLGLVANILTRALRGMRIGLPNSILGAAVSVMKYLILMSCIFNVMSVLNIVSPAKAEASLLYEPVRKSLGMAFEAYRNAHEDESLGSDSDSVAPQRGDSTQISTSAGEK